MKNYTLLLAALFSLVLADLFIGKAQERVHPALDAPKGIVAEQYSRDGRGFNEHRMYPLGFSRSGEFAYLVYTSGPWRQPTVYLKILNLITDQQIHRDVFNTRFTDPDEGIQSLLSINGKKISDTLYQFDITSPGPLFVRKFPLKMDGDVLEAGVHRSVVAGKSAQMCGGRVPEEVEIRLRSKTNGIKIIASYDTCASNTPSIEAIEGFVKSPLEDRIVVLASGTQYSSENRWDAKIIPIGAHLRKGF
jgi:hypothetical protein